MLERGIWSILEVCCCFVLQVLRDRTGCCSYTRPLYTDSPPLPSSLRSSCTLVWYTLELASWKAKQVTLKSLTGAREGACSMHCGLCGGYTLCPALEVPCLRVTVCGHECAHMHTCSWVIVSVKGIAEGWLHVWLNSYWIWLSYFRWIIHRNNLLFSRSRLCLPCLFSMRWGVVLQYIAGWFCSASYLQLLLFHMCNFFSTLLELNVLPFKWNMSTIKEKKKKKKPWWARFLVAAGLLEDGQWCSLTEDKK